MEVEAESEYEVEQILEEKYFKGKPHYLIKWKGYPKSQSTWEPIQNMEHALAYLIAWKKQKIRDDRKGKKSVPKEEPKKGKASAGKNSQNHKMTPTRFQRQVGLANQSKSSPPWKNLTKPIPSLLNLESNSESEEVCVTKERDAREGPQKFLLELQQERVKRITEKLRSASQTEQKTIPQQRLEVGAPSIPFPSRFDDPRFEIFKNSNPIEPQTNVDSNPYSASNSRSVPGAEEKKQEFEKKVVIDHKNSQEKSSPIINEQEENAEKRQEVSLISHHTSHHSQRLDLSEHSELGEGLQRSQHAQRSQQSQHLSRSNAQQHHEKDPNSDPLSGILSQSGASQNDMLSRTAPFGQINQEEEPNERGENANNLSYHSESTRANTNNRQTIPAPPISISLEPIEPEMNYSELNQSAHEQPRNSHDVMIEESESNSIISKVAYLNPRNILRVQKAIVQDGRRCFQLELEDGCLAIIGEKKMKRLYPEILCEFYESLFGDDPKLFQGR